MKAVKLLWAAGIFSGIYSGGRCQDNNIGGTLYSRQIKMGQTTRIRLPTVLVPKGTILIPYCHTLIPEQKHLRRFAK